MVLNICLKKNDIENPFWKDVVKSMFDLRSKVLPRNDNEFLSWPFWEDDSLKIPRIAKLEKGNITMVSDVLNTTWDILTNKS